MAKRWWIFSALLMAAAATAGCDENVGEPDLVERDPGRTAVELLREELRARGLDGDPLGGRGIYGDGPWDSPLDQVSNDPVAQLGMQLFYTTHLSGQDDVACVSCHVNILGGGDARSMAIGPSAAFPEVMGAARTFPEGARGKPIPRNSPTMFNALAWDRCILMDCRIESIGAEPLRGGDDGNGISTPTVGHGRLDPTAGASLLETHLRFPMNSEVVMRGLVLPELETLDYADCLADKLAGRGDCGPLLESVHNVAPEDNPWPLRFAEVFDPNFDAEQPPEVDAARDWVTFDNIAEALVAYEHTLSFAETPLRAFIEGDDEALTASQVAGGLWFFRSVADGGGDCASCHTGDMFTDEDFHNVGVVQIGPGKGHGPLRDADWGRGGITRQAADRWKFRTPTLLNVETTGPWGHNGAYTTLEDIVRTHIDPVGAYERFDVSSVPFTPAPENVAYNTEEMLRALQREPNYPFVDAPDSVVAEVVDFMTALTDPCVLSRECLAPFDPFNAGLEDANMGLLHPVDEEGCSLVDIAPNCAPAEGGDQ